MTSSGNVPFGIQDNNNASSSNALSTPNVALDDLYVKATSSIAAESEKAILALSTKNMYISTQWLRFWRKNTYECGKGNIQASDSMKASMRCIIQAGTINAVIKGYYICPSGDIIRLNKSRMRQSVISTREYTMEQFIKARESPCHKKELPRDSDSNENSGPNIIVVNGDILEGIGYCQKKKKKKLTLS